MIATKYEEIYPPEVKELIKVAFNAMTKKEVLAMETKILQVLEFDFTFPTPLRFLERLFKISSSQDDSIFYLALYMCELSQIDYGFVHFKPSMVAATALTLALRSLRKGAPWNSGLEKASGYKETDLKPCIDSMRRLLEKTNPEFTQKIKQKYSRDRYYGVSRCHIRYEP